MAQWTAEAAEQPPVESEWVKRVYRVVEPMPGKERLNVMLARPKELSPEDAKRIDGIIDRDFLACVRDRLRDAGYPEGTEVVREL